MPDEPPPAASKPSRIIKDRVFKKLGTSAANYKDTIYQGCFIDAILEYLDSLPTHAN